MALEVDDLEFQTLSILNRAQEPVGSGWLSEQLRQEGRPVSEATAGRLLRDLDHKGYTEKTGYRGRTLTGTGLRHLEELRVERSRLFRGHELLKALRVGDMQQLVQVLVARRAIEREISRLAAIKVSDGELAGIREIVTFYAQAQTASETAEWDFRFHRMLSRIAGNKVLDATTELIHQEAQQVPIPAYIAKKIKAAVVEDHWQIVTALETRDPNLAEEAMVHHINAIIEGVTTYWDEAEPGDSSQPPGKEARSDSEVAPAIEAAGARRT